MAASTKAPDRLTSLPTELLLKIIPCIPIKSYLDLAQTNHMLRMTLKSNAKQICNEAITHYHPAAARALKTAKRNGWLAPAHEVIFKSEASVGKGVKIKLTEPGPQFLFFLEYQRVGIGEYCTHMETFASGEQTAGFKYPWEDWFHDWIVCPFLREVRHSVQGRGCIRKLKSMKRELIWYYGV